jgi:hypothetical protein
MYLSNLPLSIKKMSFRTEMIGKLKGRKVAGVHFTILEDEFWQAEVIILEQKRKLIHTIKQSKGISSLDVFSSLVPTGIPLCISVDGKGVIHRVVHFQKEASPVLHIFPNANPADFIEQIQPIDNEHSFVSVIRSETLEKLVTNFSQRGYFIYQVCLGPFALNFVWHLLDLNKPELMIKSYIIAQSTGIIQSIDISENSELTNESYRLADELLDADQILPYSSAISFFSDGEAGFEFPEIKNINGKNEFLYSRFFKIGGIGIIGFLFIALLINFLLFDHYSRLFNASSLQYKSGLELISKMEELGRQVNLKEKIIEDNGLSENSHFSFYADRLAAVLPSQITLKRMEINPMPSKPKQDKELVFKHHCIRISGTCMMSIMLDTWLKILKKESWIRGIEILQYKQDNGQIQGEFIIQLETK